MKKLFIMGLALLMSANLEMALLATELHTTNEPKTAQTEAPLIGTWKGDSICQVKNSPCHDEKAIYKIVKSQEAGKFTIDLGKIVDGQPESMTIVDFTYNAKAHTLICEQKYGTWELIIKGDKLEGTLTTPDKVIYRRMTLKKET